MTTETDKLCVIVGLGQSGLSCARYLARCNEPFALTDSRTEPPELEPFRQEFPDAELKLGGFDEALLHNAKEIILSPGISMHEPAIAACIQKGIPVVGDMELFARKVQAPVLAITGTNGKSTVTLLVTEMLRAAGKKVAMGGNIGIPALDLLVEAKPDIYVLELSSFQLETTYYLHPAVATVLNISADHMDRYHDEKEYLAAKKRIYLHSDTQVVNREQPITFPTSPTHEISFGLDDPSCDQYGVREMADGLYFAHGEQILMRADELALRGRHNWSNALAAMAIANVAGAPMNTMVNVLKQFTGLPHRCQCVLKSNRIEWINDSKATNIAAAQAAIEGIGPTLDGKIIWIAGGESKNANFSGLMSSLEKYVGTAILFGRDANIIAEYCGQQTPVLFADDLEQVVRIAQRCAHPGDVVLFSPACASFDMFKNFEERGEQFKQHVRNIIAHGPL